ncbi:MAG: hypothetical protein ABI696_07580 [Rubrivivax sp.]
MTSDRLPAESRSDRLFPLALGASLAIAALALVVVLLPPVVAPAQQARAPVQAPASSLALLAAPAALPGDTTVPDAAQALQARRDDPLEAEAPTF